jgi:flagellar hook-associated protein 2
MVEVTKPDYLSLVNQNGSGFNVSELVDAMVSAEIEPKRSVQNSKLEKTENAISGLGYLNSQATLTQDAFGSISEISFYEVASSDENSVGLITTDESKLEVSNRTISNIQIAKKMVFELGGFTSVSDTLEPTGVTIDVDFGTWTENNSDNFSFAMASDNVTQQVTFTDKSLTQVAALFNQVDGISAQIIDTTGDGSNYSLVLTSDNTGSNNGFRLSEASNTVRWETSFTPISDGSPNIYSQIATNATFDLDGITISRTDNTISNVIEGLTVKLNADVSGDISINTTRSENQIRQTVVETIEALNEFKAEIGRLTYVDVEGEENGPLVLETSATILKSDFKRLAIEPLQGFGANAIYLSQLGIKTNSDGEFYLDESIFSNTLANNPSHFTALKEDNLSSNSTAATVAKSLFTSIPSGTYTVTQDSAGDWYFGDTALLQVDLSDGGSQFTSVTYPGLIIRTQDRVPSDFDIYVGKSFATKVSELMSDALDSNSSISSAREAYESLSEDINERLEKLDVREELISTRYTEQFGAMESAMTQFNSTKTMLENFIEAWKKQK